MNRIHIKKASVGFLMAAGLLVAAVPNVEATLTIDSSTAYVHHFTTASEVQVSDIVSALGVSSSDVGTSLYSSPPSGSGETGSLVNSYDTTSGDPNNSAGGYPIVVTYVPGQPVAEATYLLVKDGDLGSFLYNLGATGLNALNWDGTDEIDIYNLFNFDLQHPKPNTTGVSHIEVFGAAAVPEPSTIIAGALLLLPLGASAIRILRKSAQV